MNQNMTVTQAAKEPFEEYFAARVDDNGDEVSGYEITERGEEKAWIWIEEPVGNER